MAEKKDKKWDWKLFILLGPLGFSLGQLYRWITDERCEILLAGYGHGFFVIARGYQCKYLDEKCEDYTNEGYACQLWRKENPTFLEKDYRCICQLRYGNYTIEDWRTETRPSGADNSG